MEKTALRVDARMAKIKKELNEKKIPKSGHNKFGGFYYHELSDFMPFINELNEKHGVNDEIYISAEERCCRLTLTNVDDVENISVVELPYVEAEMLGKGGTPSNVDAIQRLGATITYLRRYLYMTAYNIQENDSVDTADNTTTSKTSVSGRDFQKAETQPKPATSGQSGDTASQAQIKLIMKLQSEGKVPSDTKGWEKTKTGSITNITLTKKEASAIISGANRPAPTPIPQEAGGEVAVDDDLPF